MKPLHGDAAWRRLLTTIVDYGRVVSPRGQATLEVLHANSIVLDLAQPVVTSPERKLNYRFQCAEALWILSGSNELAPLTRFVKRMAEFSDDGQTLAGAYGPPITRQLDYVVNALVKDRDTRQAVLTIWQPNPRPSKDIPCTVAMTFSIRDGRLHQHVFMRSSDAWLGIPYDMFSFACVGLKVACLYNLHAITRFEAAPVVSPGQLTISMTSSHLYERDLPAVDRVLDSPLSDPVDPVPADVLLTGRWCALEDSLIAVRDLPDEALDTVLWRCRP
jgi:thymidylate synthase